MQLEWNSRPHPSTKAQQSPEIQSIDILPNFVEICSEVFEKSCWQTNKPTRATLKLDFSLNFVFGFQCSVNILENVMKFKIKLNSEYLRFCIRKAAMWSVI